MHLSVHVKTRKSTESISWLDETTLVVCVHEAPVKGKANDAVIGLLSSYFDVPKQSITIIRGLTTSLKHIEIPLTTEQCRAVGQYRREKKGGTA
ncbi:DUF167 domain-containing protein [Candidatus Uhrbacteria bacterium]|nr:DUF167 domain-containing protein [Candidatus Uhrbacteria bacterium]